MTLTGAGTLAGAGNAAYIYMPVTVDEVGDLADADDWNRFSEVVPPDIAVDSALIRSLGALWDRMLVVLESAPSILKRARQIIQGNNETTTLRVTRVGATPTGPGEVYFANAQNAQVLFWPPAQTKGGVAFDVDNLKEFKAADFMRYGGVEWQIGDTPWATFQGSVLQANMVFADGYVYDAADVPAVNATADLVLDGRDIHLGLVVTAILKRATNNLGGKGGVAGAVWAYASSATNATWRSLLVVLKADADTAAKKADYRAAIRAADAWAPTAGNHYTASQVLAAGDVDKWVSVFTSNANADISLAGSIGNEGDRIVLALRTQGNFLIRVKWVDGTIKVWNAHGLSELTAAGTIDLITNGGNRAIIHMAVKTGAAEWTIREGVWQ